MNEYISFIDRMEGKYNLRPGILTQLVKNESGGNIDAISPKGAIGLTQLLPDTASDLEINPEEAFQNIEGGAKYLRQQLDTFGNSYAQALAAYNAGPNNEAVMNRDWDRLPEETKNFVGKFDLIGTDESTEGYEIVDEDNEPEEGYEIVDDIKTAPKTEEGYEIAIDYRKGKDGKYHPVYTGDEDEGIESIAPELYLIGGPIVGKGLVKGAEAGIRVGKSLSGKIGKKLGVKNISDVAKDTAIDFVFDNLPVDVPFSLSALRALRSLAKGRISAKEAAKEGLTDATVDWVLSNLPVNIPGGATTVKIALGAFSKNKSRTDDILSAVEKRSRKSGNSHR